MEKCHFSDYYKSPLGTLKICSTKSKIISIQFTNKNITSIPKKTPPPLQMCKKQLQEYFKGKRKTFSLPIKFEGTDFQIKVWQELQNIPFGKTASYKDIAKLVGKPLSSRAVGNANNKNLLAIIIPCHRVVQASGKIGGYAAGTKTKKALLEHEQQQ